MTLAASTNRKHDKSGRGGIRATLIKSAIVLIIPRLFTLGGGKIQGFKRAIKSLLDEQQGDRRPAAPSPVHCQRRALQGCQDVGVLQP